MRTALSMANEDWKKYEVRWTCPVLFHKRRLVVKALSPEEAAEIVWEHTGSKPETIEELETGSA